ncbi:MAG: Mth938-like domain-containing protein [Beijerinckiaceae bacterium]
MPISQPKYAGFLPGTHRIEAYGQGGFSFGGMSHRGSILALPSGIRAWNATVPQDITVEALAPLFAEEKGLVEYLLVGTGRDFVPLDKALRQRLREVGIVVEAMATGAAARTYSILLDEGRRVAAALLAAP